MEPAQIMLLKVSRGPDDEGEDGVKEALHVASDTGGTLTYCKVLERLPPEDVVPHPDVIVSFHPTYDKF